jgi:hypothetical protein
VDAVDGAHFDARGVFGSDAGLGDHVGHGTSLYLLKKMGRRKCIKARTESAPRAAGQPDNAQRMTHSTPPPRISRPRIALMIVIDVVGVVLAVGLYLWMKPRDSDAAILGAISPLVFAAFFNLVIALVSLKP